MKFKIMLMLVLLLSGCTTVNDWKPSSWGPKDQPEDNTTQTNQTNTTGVVEKKQEGWFIESNYTNLFIFGSEGACMFIRDMYNETYLINCGGDEYLRAMYKIKQLGFDNVSYMILTDKLERNIKNADKLSLKFRPKKIYETGIPSEFERYKEFDFNDIEYVTEDTIINGIRLIPSYKDGFDESNKHLNSIVFLMKDFISMGICFNDCEEKITDENIKIMFLANKGRCTTNSLFFIIGINPKDIIHQGEICTDIKSDLEVMDIPTNDLTQKDLWIIINETGYEIR